MHHDAGYKRASRRLDSSFSDRSRAPAIPGLAPAMRSVRSWQISTFSLQLLEDCCCLHVSTFQFSQPSDMLISFSNCFYCFRACAYTLLRVLICMRTHFHAQNCSPVPQVQRQPTSMAFIRFRYLHKGLVLFCLPYQSQSGTSCKVRCLRRPFWVPLCFVPFPILKGVGKLCKCTGPHPVQLRPILHYMQ